MTDTRQPHPDGGAVPATRVGIVGYGTIGKRVADAVSRQPDMELAGVAKRSPDYAAALAREAAIPLFAAGPQSRERFASTDIRTDGTLADLVERVDVVVDATPSGVGAEHGARYANADTPAVFQGGEDPSVAETSFTARANFDEAVGADSVRVLSCNCTGLTRLLVPLEEAYGVETARATLIRRGGDPGQTDRGPINDILPDPLGESHHAADVQTVLPEMDVRTRGVKVPATNMHVQSVRVTLTDPPDSAEHVRDTLGRESRLLLLAEGFGVAGCGDLLDMGRDLQRPRTDLWENCVFAGSVELDDDECTLFQAIDQESDVVPENVDAIRAVAESADSARSRALTDRSLGLGAPPTTAGDRRETAVDYGSD